MGLELAIYGSSQEYLELVFEVQKCLQLLLLSCTQVFVLELLDRLDDMG